MRKLFANAGARCVAAMLLLALAFAPATVRAQSTLLDQTGVPYAAGAKGELLLQSYAVSGGTLYVWTLRDANESGPVLAVASNFVPSSAGGLTRYLALTNAKSDLGVTMTASAGTPSGTVGVSRTAGTSLQLVGEATSSNAKTDKALFEFNLPDSYVAGQNIAVTVGCGYTGSGTINGPSTTMTVAANSEAGGVETPLTVSAAQQMSASGNLVFTITGTGLVPGQHVTIEATMLVTSSSGANTGFISSVSYGA
jgi:hypothetical protein